jgi:hypothetical protein
MKKLSLFLAVLFVFAVAHLHAQTRSENTIQYMITFDAKEQVYTAWLVPKYETPNSNNPDSEEKGATAQLSFRVPKDFIISDIKDRRGNWEKSPSRLEESAYTRQLGVSFDGAYYIMGKSPLETNYGVMSPNEPVALFTFKGSRELTDKELVILNDEDEFTKTAYDKLALNISSSFYSRSGQKAKIDAKPLEQFMGQMTLKELLKAQSQKYEANSVIPENEGSNIISFPNPVEEVMTVKYFATSKSENGEWMLTDSQGKEVKKEKISLELGMNTWTISLKDMPAGMLLLKVSDEQQGHVKRIMKL